MPTSAVEDDRLVAMFKAEEAKRHPHVLGHFQRRDTLMNQAKAALDPLWKEIHTLDAYLLHAHRGRISAALTGADPRSGHVTGEIVLQKILGGQHAPLPFEIAGSTIVFEGQGRRAYDAGRMDPLLSDLAAWAAEVIYGSV